MDNDTLDILLLAVGAGVAFLAVQHMRAGISPVPTSIRGEPTCTSGGHIGGMNITRYHGLEEAGYTPRYAPNPWGLPIIDYKWLDEVGLKKRVNPHTSECMKIYGSVM